MDIPKIARLIIPFKKFKVKFLAFAGVHTLFLKSITCITMPHIA